MGYLFLTVLVIVIAFVITRLSRLEHQENMAKIANALTKEMKEYIDTQVQECVKTEVKNNLELNFMKKCNNLK